MMTNGNLPTVEKLRTWAQARGYQVAWGPMHAVEAVRHGIESRLRAGELDRDFARENLGFAFPPASADVDSRRALVVLMPRPAHLVSFQFAGGTIDTLLPPTYLDYRPLFERVRRELLDGPLSGATVEPLDIPLKPLAASLGLVRYGRNNVTYAAAAGSWFQLFGYSTDAELRVEPDWRPRPATLLDECDRCGVCEAMCPTGAITGERVLLRAERCLTLATETPGPWPAWAPASDAECLVGCLSCQRACPANPPLPIEDSGVVFSEEETASLLGPAAREGARLAAASEKLTRLGLSFDADLVGRNLKMLAAGRLRPGRTGASRT